MPCPQSGKPIEGAFRHSDVNIGWYPFRTTRATEIRTLPGIDRGRRLEALAPGKGLGVQSKRNPRMRKDPEHREAVTRDGKQHVWCYKRAGDDIGPDGKRTGNTTGWICFEHIEQHRLTNKPARGPARLDFEVGHGEPRGHPPGSDSGCGRDIRDRSQDERTRVASGRELYLRYSPRETAFHYLHAGDVVLEILVNSSGFHFVEVVQSTPANPADAGTRGWVEAKFLRTAN